MADPGRAVAQLRQRSVLLVSRLIASVGIAAMVVSLIPPMPAVAADETITGGSNKTGRIDEYIDLSGLTVNGDPGDTVPVSLHVDGGVLSMTDIAG